MRRFFLCIFFLFLSFFVYGEYQAVDTKYFTIVYDDQVSSNSARVLAENADSVAEELFQYFSVKSFTSRFPIFLKPGQEMLNGYYTSSPYKHMVIYDTLPIDNVISNNSESLVSVFKHELTHVITMGRFFAFTYPMPISEGVAVLAESFNGEGRLNDPRVRELIIQDKLDGQVWTWSDFERRDTYPSGSFGYLYGGAFSEFLVKIYGDEKYNNFLTMHPKWFTNRNFKLAFNKSIGELVEAFLDTVAIPENCQVPNLLYDNKSLYKSLASYKGLVYIADSNEGAVFSYNPKTRARKKLFNINNSVYNLSISREGILAVSYFTPENGAVLSKVNLYDLDKQRFLDEEYSSLRYASVSGDSKSICGVRVLDQSAELVLINRTTKQTRSLFKCVPGDEYTNIYQVVAIDDNTYAAVFGRGIYRDIAVISSDGAVKRVNLPFKTSALADLSFSPDLGLAVFSYFPEGEISLTRLATWDPKSNEVKTLNANISGGTHLPTALYEPETKSLNFVVVSSHSTYDLLSTVDESALTKNRSATLVVLDKPTVGREPETLETKKYNPIMKMWIPSVMPWLAIGTDFKNTSYGLTLSSQDLISRLSYSFTAGIMPLPTFAQLEFTGNLHLGADTLSLDVFDRASVSSDTSGTRQTGFGFRNSYMFTPGVKALSLTLGTSLFSTWYSIFDPTRVIYTQSYDAGVFRASQSLLVSMGWHRERLGARFFANDNYGFANGFSVACAVEYQSAKTAVAVQDIFTAMTPVVPLTISASVAFTHNAYLQPTSATYLFRDAIGLVGGSYLPEMGEHENYFDKTLYTDTTNLYLGADLQLRILSVEIQKGSAWLPICYSRVNWDIGGKVVAGFQLLKGNFPIFLASAYTSLTLDISGASTLGVKYSHPIVKSAKLGKFQLIFELDI